MVDVLVVERPHGSHRVLKLNSGISGRNWLNWRPGGSLRWIVETACLKGWGVVCEKPAPPRL
jgi:hypothetical protein